MDNKIGVSHLWGDPNFDWKGLDDAAQYLERQCRRWARMGIYTKEKYGTLRVSTTCAYWNYWPLHSAIHPGYAYYQWPRWMITWLEYPLAEVFMFLRVTRLINCYQRAVLKYFWKRAAKKWSHIAEEILDEYEWTVGDES